MILKHKQNTGQLDIEILITYPVKSRTVERILALLKSFDTKIECFSDESVKLISCSDIYYIESVDNKTIVCCEKENYTVKSRLYQMYNLLKDKGFIQISKYCILNISKLKRIKPLVNSHLEAELSNGMCLYVTRKYLAAIRQRLQEGI